MLAMALGIAPHPGETLSALTVSPRLCTRSCWPLASVTRRSAEYVPNAVGVPEIDAEAPPLPGTIVKFVGRLPLARVQVNGAVPKVGVSKLFSGRLYGMPSDGAGT